MVEQTAPHLRLVEPSEVHLPERNDGKSERVNKQVELFPPGEAPSLVFVNMEGISSEEFIELVSGGKPAMIFDLRFVPHFAMGGLSRRSAFDLFAKHDVRYIDVFGYFDIAGKSDAASNPRLLMPRIMRVFFPSDRVRVGPIYFLIADVGGLGELVQITTSHIPKFRAAKKKKSVPWRVSLAGIGDVGTSDYFPSGDWS